MPAEQRQLLELGGQHVAAVVDARRAGRRRACWGRSSRRRRRGTGPRPSRASRAARASRTPPRRAACLPSGTRCARRRLRRSGGRERITTSPVPAAPGAASRRPRCAAAGAPRSRPRTSSTGPSAGHPPVPQPQGAIAQAAHGVQVVGGDHQRDRRCAASRAAGRCTCAGSSRRPPPAPRRRSRLGASRWRRSRSRGASACRRSRCAPGGRRSRRSRRTRAARRGQGPGLGGGSAGEERHLDRVLAAGQLVEEARRPARAATPSSPRPAPSPRVGRVRPSSTSSSVLLPEPFSPTIASAAPRATSKLTSSSATTRAPVPAEALAEGPHRDRRRLAHSVSRRLPPHAPARDRPAARRRRPAPSPTRRSSETSDGLPRRAARSAPGRGGAGA